jgi:glycosyltransferase involved in cell wall biosynthesis
MCRVSEARDGVDQHGRECGDAAVSVIIPVLNEAAGIPEFCAHWHELEARGAQVLLVDGGSQDGTVPLLKREGFAVIRSGRGRVRQMNAGAAQASGIILIFLHALAATGLPVPSIAEACGVSPSGFRAWLQRAREGNGDELEVALLERIQAGQFEAEQTLLTRVLNHSAQDWWAAAWCLTHHPRHRELYSDAAALRREQQRVLGLVADGILASRLTDAQKQEVILCIKARGAGLPEER